MLHKILFTRRHHGRVFSIALTLVAVFAVTALAAEPTELRIMSFNVRFSKAGVSEKSIENNWNDAKFPRRERAIRAIQDNSPDIFGVQEAREPQVEDLKAGLPEYGFYGVGRDDGKTGGEFSGIFYRKDRFTAHQSSSFWLSATPETPGTSFALAVDGCPRIASWVVLSDNKSRKKFVVLNMHWDHKSADARLKSAQLVRERLKNIAGDSPTIVMGDLNSNEDTNAFRTLIGNGDGNGPKLADSYRELHPKRSPNEASFEGWKGTRKGSRIDFILHTAEFAPVAAKIVRTSYDGHWPSDHYPVTATLKFKDKTNSSNDMK
ncbi:MAG TPA: endonuclease/exonuclease/phosphatase family protein [Lacipirellulaceae bacterium]|nr:endonuclease/exonuclease/phosphatase family protein [Lacipirellulaceae bacterium]